LFSIVFDSAFIRGHVIFHWSAPRLTSLRPRLFGDAEGTATAFTGSAGPPIVSTFTRAESRELHGLVTRYANGGGQVLTTRKYHVSQVKSFPAKVRIARRCKQTMRLNLFSKSVNHFGATSVVWALRGHVRGGVGCHKRHSDVVNEAAERSGVRCRIVERLPHASHHLLRGIRGRWRQIRRC
jgi:hypothetical protein